MEDDISFTEVVARSKSIAEVLWLLKRARVGSNYDMVRSRVDQLGLSTSHWVRLSP
jgi:hypothetical protein